MSRRSPGKRPQTAASRLDANGQSLAYVYGLDNARNAAITKGLTFDEARRIIEQHCEAANATRKGLVEKQPMAGGNSMRLISWQRVGIIASVVWVVEGPSYFNLRREDNDRRIAGDRYQLCIKQAWADKG